ncbi:MAG: heterodisulfide reductase-related iron-sulfur binding cluster [Dehalococcoidia bacterium]|jgi:Fe-S oxidoreductase/nitrate reductase gamma subunit|nr:heterodisulfide reductase-related iron-sulfur binding cluster [Dehalococcoidia bacterium]
MPEYAGRSDFWNIGYPLAGALVYLVAPVALAAIVYALRRRWRMWHTAGADPDLGPASERWKAFLAFAAAGLLAHRQFVRKRDLYPGIMHLAIFWGFGILLIATTIAALEFNAEKYLNWTWPTVHARIPLGFTWDVFGGGLAALGLTMALWRRYVIRPGRLNTVLDDGVVLVFLFTILISGFLIEALRIGATELNPASIYYDTSVAGWSPIGWVVAKALIGIGFTFTALETLHAVAWWLHAGIFLGAIVYAAARFSRLTHMIVSPMNWYYRNLRSRGALKPMGDFETLETFGAKDLPDLAWTQLLGYDACTNCGRCQDVCPAHLSGKPLSPRKLIQGMRGYMEERSPVLLGTPAGENAPAPAVSMVHDSAGDEVLWSCLTCAACLDACPVEINHIDSIVDMRRFLTLEEASTPDTAMSAMQSIEQRGHPWRGTTLTRTSWMDGLDIPTLAEKPDSEVLFWVGCSGALVQRGVDTTRAMASVLKKAGIDFAVLGDEESCTGDPARRLGNEYLFQVQAESNVQTFTKYDVKKIITTCPHCFNTIKNEYPQLGGNYDVVHYTAFVGELLKQGRLKPTEAGIGKIGTVAYHDSCYLGRHNGEFGAPREIISSIPGLDFVEMDRNRERSFCCGAGGGRMWMEEDGERVNQMRTEQFLETGAGTVAVSCPFCIQMFDEGITAKGQEDDKRAVDLITILDRATD